MSDGAQTDPSLNKTEHIDENISAKRAAVYAHDGSNWQRLQVDGSGNLKTVSSGSAITNYALETGGNLATITDNTSKDDTNFVYYTAALTATDTIVPTSGKAIKVYKVLVTNSSNNTTFRNVVLSGATKGNFLQGEAIASSWRTLLDTDEILSITPGGSSGTIYVNIQYKEV